MKKNVYDIRYEENLIYILSEESDSISGFLENRIYDKIAIFLYLYYLDTLPVYFFYIDGIQKEIDVYIISSCREVLKKVQEYISLSGRKRIYYILKNNCGRDVSALLVTCADFIKKYEYVCFLHDKKEHHKELKEDIDLWIINLWGNMIKNSHYINNVLRLFLDDLSLGVLVPPEPIGRHFNTWYGYGWHQSFGITQSIARNLRLDADIKMDKPPITLGTVLWFRTDAMKKLFDIGWKYSDFDDDKLIYGNYLSYGIERIFAYIAQDAGYYTGTIMTTSYAMKQLNYLQHETNLISKEAEIYFPITKLDDLECYKRNKHHIIEFAKRNERVYLYGAGNMGRLCSNILRRENILPAGFIVSKNCGTSMMECLPVVEIDKLEGLHNMAIIITVYDNESQKEIVKILKKRKCTNYIKLWERSLFNREFLT